MALSALHKSTIDRFVLHATFAVTEHVSPGSGARLAERAWFRLPGSPENRITTTHPATNATETIAASTCASLLDVRQPRLSQSQNLKLEPMLNVQSLAMLARLHDLRSTDS